MAADHEPRHLLFVDDEPSTHRLVLEALRGEDLRLTCVTDGARALHVLERGRVELLVTSLMLPVVDGVDLLRHLANRGLTIPVIVTTDREPPAALPRSPLRFIREPFQPVTLVAAVRERLAASPPSGAIAVAELAQILTLVRRSCTLHAQVNGVHGDLSFHAGALIDASVGGVHGEAAARALLAWRRAMVRVEPLTRRVSTIQSSLEALLPTLAEGVALSVEERVASVAVQVSSALRERQPEGPRHDPTASQVTPARPPPALYIVPDDPSPRPADVPAWERPAAQAAIAALLTEALKIEGAVGVGLGVWELDHCVDVRTRESALPVAAMRAVLSGHSRMLRATMTTMRRLGKPSDVSDMLIMLDAHTHVLVPLPHADGLFLDLALDRARGTAAHARMRVGALLQGLRLDPDDAPRDG
jgi:CheY-like chemotaxis protein